MDSKRTGVVEFIASPSAGAILAVGTNDFLPDLVFVDLDLPLLEKIAFNDDERASGKQGRALYELGRRYQDATHFVKASKKTARKLYCKSSRFGCAVGSFAFGSWLLHGIGGKQNVARGVKALELAQQQNKADPKCDETLAMLIDSALMLPRRLSPEQLQKELPRIKAAAERATARETHVRTQTTKKSVERQIAAVDRAISDRGAAFSSRQMLELLSVCIVQNCDAAKFAQLLAIVAALPHSPLDVLVKVQCRELESIVGALSLIQQAALFNRASMIELLAEHGASVNLVAAAVPVLAEKISPAIDHAYHSLNCSMPALLLACLLGYDDCVKSLLARGADPNLADPNGVTPLHGAVRHSDMDRKNADQPDARSLVCVQLILDSGAKKDTSNKTVINVNARDKYNHTPLYDATCYDFVAALPLLIDAKADVHLRYRAKFCKAGSTESRQYDDLTLIHIAVLQRNSTRALGFFLDHGLSPDAGDALGYRPLALAVMCSHVEMFQMLLERKANVNLPDKMGTTILMQACHLNQADVVRTLLAQRAQVNARNTESWTALMVACAAGNEDCVRVLLRPEVITSVDLNVRLTANSRGFRSGDSALTIARSRGFAQIAQLLGDAGAAQDPKDVNKSSTMPLTKGEGETQIQSSAFLCWCCGNGSAKLKTCGRCHRARYCSVECQQFHWPLHKRTCIKNA